MFIVSIISNNNAVMIIIILPTKTFINVINKRIYSIMKKKSIGPPLKPLNVMMIGRIFKVVLNSSPGFLNVFQRLSLDIGCFFIFSPVLLLDHFQKNVFSVFSTDL